MESSEAGVETGTGDPPRWYSKAAFDEFNAAAAAERARLEAVIAEASARLANASAATGLNRAMTEMVVRSQRDVQTIRSQAEAQVASILAGAAEFPADGLPAEPVDGLVAAPVGGAGDQTVAAPMVAFVDPGSARRPTAGADDDYFTRLKDSLGGRDELGSLDDD